MICEKGSIESSFKVNAISDYVDVFPCFSRSSLVPRRVRISAIVEKENKSRLAVH